MRHLVYISVVGADRIPVAGGVDRVEHVTVELAVGWALHTANPASCWRAQRLGVVRCFARYLHSIDARHQIPPADLLPPGHRRPMPYFYSDSDIAALMAAARQLRSPLRAATVETIIGLLAVTGLRVGEVVRLDRDDVDFERCLLIVSNSKGRSRHVPLHASTAEALLAYRLRRDELLGRPGSSALFVSTAGTRLRAGNLRTAFLEVLQRSGLEPPPGRKGPRIGDLRHSFAVSTVLRWYLADVEVAPRLPVLSTYLGHVSPASTYWYLSASPPLLAAAARRLDNAREVLP